MTEQDELEQVEEEAQTLMDAAAVLEQYAEDTADADASIFAREGEDPEELADAAEEMEEDLREAADVCKALSVSQTIAMIQAGHVPDLEEPNANEEDDDTDDMPSKTFG